jgi:asparagine synthase (glutamine-hydrolysing)
MLERIAHRGPDGAGAVNLGWVSLGHRRLAIVDVERGVQPLRATDGTAAAVVNGEIYNHRDLRRELERLGRFTSDSDSEVVLHGSRTSGEGFVKELDGMFAFVFSDGKQVLAARDPLGIKPLYLGRKADGTVCFASEFKALIDDCESIESLPPGHWFTAQGGPVRYFNPRWSVHEAGGEPRRAALAAALTRAVEKRLMSDVPVGVFLSGGLDSSLVAAIARKRLPGLHSFAVGVENAPDLAAARAVARELETRHHEVVIGSRDVESSLASIIYHLESYDPALVRSSVPCYFLSRAASEFVKVVLTGEGADEAFAGYSYFGDISDPQALQAECVRLLEGLHSMNLQRLDRMTMAHGLEGRVPFLDVELLSLAMSLDPRLKLHSADRQEKWLLRRAGEGLLPREILWRKKAEFSTGAGIEGLLLEYAEKAVSDRDFQRRRELFPIDTPRTKEEQLYRQIFESVFPGDKVRHLVARWEGRVPSRPAAKATAVSTGTGDLTYRQSVERGFYGRYNGGLYGKYDNVRIYWEDQTTLVTLQPHLKGLLERRGAPLRVVDLGCGAGQGFDLLTSLRGERDGESDSKRPLLSESDIALYFGLDLSSAMVEQGRHNFAGHPRVRFAEADLREGLAAVGAEPAFDVYLSTYGSLSHLGSADFERLLGDVAEHGRDGSILVVDLLGRHSPEWPGHWSGDTEADRYREYSMSYLYEPSERHRVEVEKFMIRYWTRAELEEVCERLSTPGRRLELERTVDRSLFVGRHVDTAEYGTPLPPLRAAVNRLHEPHVRTDLADLEIPDLTFPGFPEQQRVFSELAFCWNTLVRFAQRRLEGKRADLLSSAEWRRYPPVLQAALLHFDRAVDAMSWMTVGEPRENLLEPHLGYLLRSLERGLQPGWGYGHGLLGIIRIRK